MEEKQIDLNKKTYIVMVLGYWGGGKTIKEAAKKVEEQGAAATDRAIVRLVLGDDTAEVSVNGAIIYDEPAKILNVANGFKLGALLKLED